MCDASPIVGQQLSILRGSSAWNRPDIPKSLPVVGAQLTPYVGYLAAGLAVVSLIPQVLRAWRTKQTEALSGRTFLLLITAGVLWLTYGMLASDWPVIATNAGMVVLNG